MSNTQRIILVVLAGVVIVGSLVLFTPDDGDDEPAGGTTETSQPADTGTTATATPAPPRPKVTTIAVRRGESVAGPTPVKARKGETVRINVISDSEQEVHLHGYDITRDAGLGRPARFVFKADVEGVFEIELHGTGALIGKLEVRPS